MHRPCPRDGMESWKTQVDLPELSKIEEGQKVGGVEVSMERMTKRNSDGKGCIPCHWKESAEAVDKGQERLAEIEDILGDTYDLDRLRELVEADKAGRCFVSAVKIGDHVFDVGEGTIDEWEVTGISIGDACLELYGNEIVEYDDEVIVTAKGVTVYGKMQFPVYSIDEDVYRTQEAAEAALAKEEGQCDVK